MDSQNRYNTFEIFLSDLIIDGETFKFFDVSKINDEKYGLNLLRFDLMVIK